MEWEEYGQKFELDRDPFFEKRVLTSLARKMPKNVCHSAMHPRFPFFLTILLHVGAFGSSWSFSCVFHSTFLVVGFIFSHGWEVVFVVLGIGLFSSRFGGAAEVFLCLSIHVLVAGFIFPMDWRSFL